eukprot:CAMPEP_0167743316 /NCGR_PEP_ID=MMETSP0110_2-20121227/1947_1 /TAXON_ID=629695 /ORGANISM="Gymnochlora sp., Strain CCMP2014" /LENGTH=190 /DNA_ID=CAMNT_0007627671 /DNA_START=21 /DNA_END=593 /DNA_ORIENTATION=+
MDPASDSEEKTTLMGRIGSALANKTMESFKEQGSKVAEMITKGPLSLKVMCLFGGILTVLSGFFGMMNLLSPFDILVSMYNFLFGLVMVFLEVHDKVPLLGFLHKRIEHWMRILTTLTGRSLFYFYVGSLYLSKWTFFGIFFGIYLCACGLFSLIVGKAAAQKLEAAQFELGDMEPGCTFEGYDSNDMKI